MLRYVVRRTLVGVLMLWLVSILIFVVLRLLPGDPTIQKVGVTAGVDQETLDAVRRDLGLDEPIGLQYLHWLAGVARGDFGKSYFSSFGVTELIGQRVAPTVLLAAAGLLLGVLIAVPLALAPELSDTWLGRLIGRVVGAFTTLGMAAPPFVFGIALIAIFTVRLGWVPRSGYVSPLVDPAEAARLLFLPALTLGITLAAPLIRYLRAALEDVRASSFVRTAVGKGIPRTSVLLRHVLPNALLPALTVLGVMVGSLLGGVVVVEYVFRWPGLGTLIVDSVFKRDYAVLQTGVLLAAAAFVVANLVTDILYGVLDPRLRVTSAPRSRKRSGAAAVSPPPPAPPPPPPAASPKEVEA